MIIPQTQSTALLAALTSTVFWGSWSNFLVLAGDRIRFELFYVDFSIAVLVMSVVSACTFGLVKTDGPGGNTTVLDDFGNVTSAKVTFALLGGMFFNIGNYVLCKGIGMLGLALAFPLSVGSSMVLGTLLSYLVAPSGQATMLFGGLFVAFCAVCTAACMHKLKSSHETVEKARETAKQLVDPQEQPSVVRSLVVCLVGAFFLTGWNPLTAMSQTSPHGFSSPYGCFCVFCAGVVFTTMFLSPFTIAYPVEGNTGEEVMPILRQYFKIPLRCHWYGLGSGVTWAIGGLGNALASASKILNPAESFAIGNCCMLMAIFYGVFFFKELAGTHCMVKGLAFLCVLLFIGAILLIAAAS